MVKLKTYWVRYLIEINNIFISHYKIIKRRVLTKKEPAAYPIAKKQVSQFSSYLK